MGKKNKNNSGPRPNAPNFQILQQPPHNPYYADPSAALLTPPPPPYSDLTVPINSTNNYFNRQLQAVPMAEISNNSASNISYPRIQSDGNSSHVIIRTAINDRGIEVRQQKVRSFTNQALMIAILSIALSVWAYNLYEDRTCIVDFSVHQPNKDINITIKDVRQMHLAIAYMSGFLAIVCLLRIAAGYGSKSYMCYLFLVALLTFVTTISTIYLAYLAFRSPCTLKASNIARNIGKSVFGSAIVDSFQTPDYETGQGTVFERGNEDRTGIVIFVFDVINVIFHSSIFLSSLCIC